MGSHTCEQGAAQLSMRGQVCCAWWLEELVSEVAGHGGRLFHVLQGEAAVPWGCAPRGTLRVPQRTREAALFCVGCPPPTLRTLACTQVVNMTKDNKRVVAELAAAASSAQAGQLERDDLQAKHTVSCSWMVLLGWSTWEGLQGGWCAGRLTRLRLLAELAEGCGRSGGVRERWILGGGLLCQSR